MLTLSVPAYTLVFPALLVGCAWLLSVKRIERTRSLAKGLKRHYEQEVLSLEQRIREAVTDTEAHFAEENRKLRAECDRILQKERDAFHRERAAFARKQRWS